MQQSGAETKGEIQTKGVRPVDDPRIFLAAERTFLAWIRTAIALMGFGFLIARFGLMLREPTVAGELGHSNRVMLSPWLGAGMLSVGIIVSLAAAHRHHNYVRALQSGVTNPDLNIITPMIMALILAIVGLTMAINLIAI